MIRISKIDKKITQFKSIFLNDLIYLNKYKTNGIFSAIENAVIFLFAVTPFS